MEWMPALVAAIGGSVTLAGLLLARRQNRAQATKSEADAAQVITAAARDAIELSVGPLKAKVADLEARLDAAESRLTEVEEDRTVLADAMKVQVAWEDSGRLDPPGAPQTSAKVRSVLNRLHAV